MVAAGDRRRAAARTGLAAYAAILIEPRYRATLINTVVLAAATTIAALVVATIAGLFLQRTAISRPRRADRHADLPARVSRRGGRLHDHLAGGAPGPDRRPDAAVVRRKNRVRLFDPGPVPRLSVLLHSARDPDHHGGGGEARPGAGGSGARARRRALGGAPRRRYCRRSARPSSPPVPSPLRPPWAPSAPPSRSPPTSMCCRC